MDLVYSQSSKLTYTWRILHYKFHNKIISFNYANYIQGYDYTFTMLIKDYNYGLKQNKMLKRYIQHKYRTFKPVILYSNIASGSQISSTYSLCDYSPMGEM